MFYVLIMVLAIVTCTKSKESGMKSYAEEEKIIEKVIKYKYSSINTLEKLNIAFEIYIDENIILEKEGLFEKVSNYTYDLNERIYIIKLYDRFIEKAPDIVIPRLVSLSKCSGASDLEYLVGYLGSFFWRNPRKFILAMNEDSISKHMKLESNTDSLIMRTYELFSEPLSKNYSDYGIDEYKKLIIGRIKGVDIENNFYLYLKNKYEF